MTNHPPATLIPAPAGWLAYFVDSDDTVHHRTVAGWLATLDDDGGVTHRPAVHDDAELVEAGYVPGFLFIIGPGDIPATPEDLTAAVAHHRAVSAARVEANRQAMAALLR